MYTARTNINCSYVLPRPLICWILVPRDPVEWIHLDALLPEPGERVQGLRDMVGEVGSQCCCATLTAGDSTLTITEADHPRRLPMTFALRPAVASTLATVPLHSYFPSPITDCLPTSLPTSSTSFEPERASST